MRKTRVVRRFGHSSFYLGQVHGDAFAEKFLLDPREFAAHGGCFPITVRAAEMVGTITVSGLPQEEDHRLVTDVLRNFLGHTTGRLPGGHCQSGRRAGTLSGMSLRAALAACTTSAVMLLGTTSAPAMLPATESGFRLAPPYDCGWSCVKVKRPTRYDALHTQMQAMRDAGAEPNTRLRELQQALKQYQVMQQAVADIMQRQTEIAKTLAANAR